MTNAKQFRVLNTADDTERFDIIVSFAGPRWEIVTQYTDSHRNHREPLGTCAGEAANPSEFPAEQIARDIARAMFAAFAGEEEPRDTAKRAGWLILQQRTERSPRFSWAFSWLDFSAPGQLGRFTDQLKGLFTDGETTPSAPALD